MSEFEHQKLIALVVDDEEDVQWLFKQRFRKELKAGSVDFHFAFSGEDALDQLRTGLATDLMLILSDINMPGMTGLELLKMVKDEFPDLPVHMITAYGDEKNYRTAMDYGADGYMTKPLDFEHLKARVLSL
jgi:CheY-like chemotaxis protein